MKKEIPINILVFFIIISMTSFINAAPPTFTNVNTANGLQIFYPNFEYAKQNTEFKLHLHISNLSNGMPLPNTYASCYLHLYNSSGSHTFESKALALDSNGWDYEQLINKGNFSDLGLHSYYIWCNNTAQQLGGEAKGVFEVTTTGEGLNTSNSLIYITLIIFISLFFALALFFAIIIPYGNSTDEKGAVIQVTKLKYLKIFSIAISYMSFTYLLNLLNALSINYLILTQFSGYISYLFMTFIYLSLPIGIFLIILSLFELVKDANIQKAIERYGHQ